MLRHASTKSSRNVHIFEFLAPSAFGYRSVGTASRPFVTKQQDVQHDIKKLATLPLASQAKDPAILAQNIKQRINLLNKTSPAIPASDVSFFNERVVKLRKALSAGDIPSVWIHWSQLQARDLLKLLGPQLRWYSEALARQCSRSFESWTKNPDDRQAVEEIALYAAAGGAVDALIAYMTAHLNSGDSRATLDLYRRYRHACEGKPLPAEFPNRAREEDVSDEDELAIEIPADSTPRPLVLPSVLLAAITAHALDNSSASALQTYLEAPTLITPRIRKEFLSRITDHSLRAKVENHVHRLHTARYLSEARIVTSRTSAMAANQDVQGLERIYKHIIDGLSGPEAFIVTNPADLTPEKPIYLHEINWAAFLTAFLKCNRRDLGESLWSDMLLFGCKPTAITWTALLDGYDSMKAAKDAEAAWNTMLSQGVEPSVLTYRAIISTFFNVRRPDDAIKYFGLFRQNIAGGMVATVEDSLQLYNTVLHGLLINGRGGDAHALLQNLREKGPKPDIVSYNTLLRHHGRKGEFRAVSRILEWIKEDGLVGDVYTFSTLLSALLKIGRTDATDVVLSLMRKQNIEPNVAVFTSIITHQISEGTEEGLRAAADLLQRMEQNPEVQPNEVTYTGILANLYRQDWTNPALARECKQHVLERMKKRNIQPTRATYHILVKACLENPAPEGLQDALGYFKEMSRRSVLVGSDTWYVLLRGLIAREAWAVADEMVEELNALPRGRTLYSSLGNLVWRIKHRRAWKRGLEPSAYF